MDVTLAIVVRWALVADLMMLFGVPLFSIYGVPGRVANEGPDLRVVVFATAIVGILLSAIAMLILAAGMSGVAITDVDLASIAMVVTATAVGTAFLVRIFALATVVALSWQTQRRAIVLLIAIVSAVALGSLAWSGHGVMDDGWMGTVHLTADIVHLFAAGIWVGALVVLLWQLIAADRDSAAASHSVLAGFATFGTGSVALVLVSGLINSWLLVGPAKLLSLGETLYGRLLLIKLGLFGGMLVLAALNRFRLTPDLEVALTNGNIGVATQRLRVSLALETLAAVAILGLVAWLGMLEPPASAI